MRRATYASVCVAFALIAIKFIAFILTGSVALLSSLIDSVLDSLASVLNLIAVRHALSPADKEHRFGHGKAEPLAGLGQATFVMGSSLFLIFEAINRFVHPQVIKHGNIGILVMLVSLFATWEAPALMLAASPRNYLSMPHISPRNSLMQKALAGSWVNPHLTGTPC